MNNKKVDYIIVGQGLAGCCLDYQLHKKGATTLLIDQNHLKSASFAAAGLVNPVVFKRITKSWMMDDLLPVLDRFYTELEEYLSVQFYQKRTISKLLLDPNTINLWEEKKQAGMENYLGNISIHNDGPVNLSDSQALGLVKNASSVNLPLFLTSYQKVLIEQEKLIQESFDFKALSVDKKGVEYKSNNSILQAKGVIFCEGSNVLNNPFFSWLPFRLTKGETITIKTQQKILSDVFHNGKFFLPLENNEITIGSTYEWKDLSYKKTSSAKRLFLEKYNESFSKAFNIMDHKVGVRPTVSDRKPILGTHPKHPTLHIFNGLGTKGVMLAPYFSEMFTNHLIHEKPLIPEVSIRRFSNQFNSL